MKLNNLRSMVRRLFCGVAAVCMCGVGAQALSARSAAVVDGTTGELIFAHNADEVLPMASTTKIMTALVAIEEGDLERTYTVKREYTLAEGSSMYLQEGERLTVLDTLYGLMLMSGNDAALAIAGECGGVKNFVAKMNDRAAGLGLTHTHFENPNGLDGKTHHTTARELALLAAEAMRCEKFHEIVGTKNYQSGKRMMVNHNKMLRLYPDAVGVKTGFTRKSGRCLVSAAERDGRRLIAVTLNAPDDWNDHRQMLDAGFARFSPVKLQEKGERLYQCPIEGSETAQLDLQGTKEISLSLTEEEHKRVTKRLRAPRFAYAPIVCGQTAGAVEYVLDGTVIAEDELVWSAAAEQLPPQKSGAEAFWDWLRQWFKKWNKDERES